MVTQIKTYHEADHSMVQKHLNLIFFEWLKKKKKGGEGEGNKKLRKLFNIWNTDFPPPPTYR